MSDCSCVYCDYEPIQYSNRTMPIARKEHKCGECRRTIEPGEKYECVWGVLDGTVEIYKTCVDCLSVRNSFFCGGWGYRAIWQDLEEHLWDVVRFGTGVSSSCIVSLTSRARDKVCDMIEECWKEIDGDD